ncbi:MAG TPA: methyltransferase domain-containing protein [Acetobacteraceae bacterium]|jgi:2-polyprenyl-3-methyl-5-hydroxy-6-metoxy-1,4-benzoquinol methylase|nr:methyltransferase domain-containing protein [Acetobacteraceae bacterium]
MRRLAPEIMDDPGQGEADFRAALRDLETLNRITLAYGPTLRFLDRLAKGRTHLSVLDVGAGGGDTLRRIARWGTARGLALDLVGLDRSPWSARHAEETGVPARWITADLFELDEAERFDAVICSLFAHHLEDEAVVRFLRWLHARARLGWLVLDLHRHRIPWAAVWAGTRAARMHPMVTHDGPVSIMRGFTREDWRRLVAEAGVEADIAWAMPFRWAVTGPGRP